MRAAKSLWENCISPVFDVSKYFLLIDISDSAVTQLITLRFESALPFDRAEKLAEWETKVLICGAISQTYAMAVQAKNIEIISNDFGPVEEVLHMYVNGHYYDDCAGKQKRKRHRRGREL